MTRWIITSFALVGLLISATVYAQGDPIRVGSKQFTESILLAKLIVYALEDAGFEVDDRSPLGGTDVNRSALVNAEIDVYPEYTGTALGLFFPEQAADFPEGLTRDAEASYDYVRDLDADMNDLVWLAPAPANNTYGFAVTRAFAEEHGLVTIDDFADYVNAGGFVMMASGDEFAQRPDGIQAFEQIYGFDLGDDQLLIIAAGTPAQTLQALAEGANETNIAMTFATEGAVSAYDFVVLADPRGAQPIFNPTPVFRAEVVEANPDIPSILDPIFSGLTNEVLQELNARVDVDGENPDAVARGYLQEQGFLN
jgi:osmoprotectant transport system substrate-binding protein